MNDSRNELGPSPRSGPTLCGSWQTPISSPLPTPPFRTNNAATSTATDVCPSGGSSRRAPKAGATTVGDANKTAKTRSALLAFGAFGAFALLAVPSPAAAEPAQTEPAATAPRGEAEVPQIGLDAAMRQALARNPSAKLAALDVQRAETLVAQARAQALPTLNANGIYTRLDNARAIGDRIITPEQQLQLNLLLNVPLVQPRAWSQWSRAKENVDVAQATEKQARQNLVISVARTYLAAIAQERILEVNGRARDTALAHEKYARTRFQGGLGNRLDQVRASQEVATTSAALSTAHAAVQRTREALGVLVGVDGPRRPEPKPSLGNLPSEAEATHEIGQRPDVAAQQARRTAARHQARDNWVDFLPLLNGTFQPFYQNPATPQFPTTGWQAQLLLSIPLYDGGVRYGVHRQRKIDEQAQVAQLENVMRQAKADIRIATEAIRRADEALHDSREAAQLSAESLRLATLAYEAGATTNLEVIDAERRARDAETDVTIKEDSARQARLDLLVASGRLP